MPIGIIINTIAIFLECNFTFTIKYYEKNKAS